MSPESFVELAETLGDTLKRQKSVLVTAESCTGGWIAQVATSVAGSSHWFDRGFITYTNQSKQDMLGVRFETLRQHGAVSEPVVREMAEGALTRSEATCSLSVSGIAGPGGGSAAKPVGTVCFAWGGRERQTISETKKFDGDRSQVRAQALEHSLRGLMAFLES